MIVYTWLVAQGLYRDLLSAGILVPIMHVMALKPIKRLLSELSHHGEER